MRSSRSRTSRSASKPAQQPYDAALHGADEIGLAVIATTLTIVVVFMPVSVMGGVVGQFFQEFGFTVAISVLFSLLVARLLTPLMAAYLMKPSSHPHQRKPFRGAYRRALEFALAHRWISMAAGGALFVGSLLLAAALPTGFTPPQDNGIVNLTLEGAPGATLDRHAAQQRTADPPARRAARRADRVHHRRLELRATATCATARSP